MKIIELIAVFFSIASVALAMKKSIHNWTVGIIGLIGYFYIFLETKLYADAALQILFIGLSIIGYFSWKGKKMKLVDINLPTNILYIFLLVTFAMLFWIFRSYTDNPMPVLDSLATTLSIGAVYLMSKTKTNCWLFWIAADLVYIAIFLQEKLYMSTSLYVVFLAMAYQGYVKWKRNEFK